MPSVEAPTKQVVSLRLPVKVIKKIDKHAKEHATSRTDAFMYYLLQGFEKVEEEKSSTTLDDIKAELDVIKAMLGEAAIEKDSELTKSKITQVVQEAASRFPQISKVWLFGSYARGVATADSDIDLRVEIEKDTKFSLYDLSQFANFIMQKTEKEVDVVSAKVIKNKALHSAIERDKVLIYER